MRRLLSILLCAGVLLGTASTAFAERPYDFSDIAQPLFTWPYKVVSFEASGVGSQTKHTIRFDVPYEKVLKDFMKFYDTKKKFGNYILIGVTNHNDGVSFECILAYNNEHNYVTISKDGAGTVAVVNAMPVSFVTGMYDIAAFGFIMPDGGTLPIGTFRHDGL